MYAFMYARMCVCMCTGTKQQGVLISFQAQSKLSYLERKPDCNKVKILPMESLTSLLYFIVIRTVDHNTISL